jgi:hypothetical protein
LLTIPNLGDNLHAAIFPIIEKIWYVSRTHTEDKAMLESNLSAEVGEQTDGQGHKTPALFFCPSGAPQSDKLRGVGGRAQTK